MITQESELFRVRSTIAPAVVEFCRAHVGDQFRMEELQRFVQLFHPSAPDSPSRILRDLRRRGIVAYRVVSRPGSLYFVEGVESSPFLTETKSTDA
jgi:hypothetical protein